MYSIENGKYYHNHVEISEEEFLEGTAVEITEPSPTPPPEEPSDFERLDAQVMYTALMTDTLLEE